MCIPQKQCHLGKLVDLSIAFDQNTLSCTNHLVLYNLALVCVVNIGGFIIVHSLIITREVLN